MKFNFYTTFIFYNLYKNNTGDIIILLLVFSLETYTFTHFYFINLVLTNFENGDNMYIQAYIVYSLLSNEILNNSNF